MIQYRSKSSASARRVKCIVLDTEVLDSHRGSQAGDAATNNHAMSPEPELAKTTDTRGGDPFFALQVLAARQRSYSMRSLHNRLGRFPVVFRVSREQTEWSAARPNPNLRFVSPKPIGS